MGRILALALCLIAATLIAWLGERPPADPAGAMAPALLAFSTSAAFTDVQAIARAPHPIGAPANAAVRDHLLRRMTALGLSPRVRSSEAAPAAQSLIGRLPGRDPNLPAVAVMAHYDSVPAGPGASDDGAGVAAALEVARALQAGGVTRRDLLVILTDGEEAGLIGAKDVFAHDPVARRIGFLVNLEARGSGGRARMFQTGPDNGETITLFARAVRSPSAASLAAFVYEFMPNDTDFTISRRAGVAGVNLAFIDGPFDYHSATDTAANLDRGALRDLGEQALAVTRAAADAPVLPRPSEPFAFHQLPAGGPLIAYPARWGWSLIAAAAGMLVLAAARSRHAGALTGADVARGVAAAAFLIIGGAVVLHAARIVAGQGLGRTALHHLNAQAGRYEAALVLLALGVLLYVPAELARGRRGVASAPLIAGGVIWAIAGFEPVGAGLAAVAVILALACFRRPTAASGAWLGVLLVLLVLAIGVQWFAPPAALALTWPLLMGSGLAAISGLWTRRTWPVRLLTMGGVTLGLAWVGGLVHGLFLGIDAPALLAAPILLAAAMAWPLVQPDKGALGTPFTAVIILLTGAALTLGVRLHEPWSARYPITAHDASRLTAPAQSAMKAP